MNYSELIAKLITLSEMLDEYEGGNFKWSEEAATAREAADALQALELAPDVKAAITMCLAHYGNDPRVEPLRRLQAMGRVPMTEEQRRAWLPVGLLTTEELYYFRGLRDAEAFHNIKPPESKVSG